MCKVNLEHLVIRERKEAIQKDSGGNVNQHALVEMGQCENRHVNGSKYTLVCSNDTKTKTNTPG